MFPVLLAAIGANAAVSFGPPPWQKYEENGPNLLISHSERRLSSTPNDGSCARWIEALITQKAGVPLDGAVSAAGSVTVSAAGSTVVSSWVEAFKRSWEPWTQDELKTIRECTEEPCLVKLAPNEVGELKNVEEQLRPARYLEVVGKRVGHYLSTGERREYEFPEPPSETMAQDKIAGKSKGAGPGVVVDPWNYFESFGYRSPLARPATGTLWARKIELISREGKDSQQARDVKTIHQVMDRRVAVSVDRKKAVVWVRDAYTDHYFDSWGEWTSLECDAQGAVLVQALFLELDLLKKSDLFSMIMRGRMRSEVRMQGDRYLEEQSRKLSSLLSGSAPATR